MIDISNNGWSVKQIQTMKRNGKLRFDHPIQRSGGQWDRERQSLLIHTLAYTSLPVPSLYAVSYEEAIDDSGKLFPVRYMLDGNQRLTTTLSYLNNEFATVETLDEVYIEGEAYEIGGKLFDELDEAVQDAILGKMLTVYTIKGSLATDEEIEDMFFRMNNGVALTKSQQAKAKMGVAWATRLKELAEHRVITEFSAFSQAQIKGEKHISAILQAMMMLDDYDYKNVSEKVIAEYSLTFKEDADEKLQLFKKIEEAIDYLDRVFDEKEKVFMKKVHFPMMLTTAVMAVENQIPVPDFKNWLPVFKEEFKKKEEETPNETALTTNYFVYTGKGSTDRPKADGRMQEMARHLNAYLRERTFIEATDAMAKDAYEQGFTSEDEENKDVPF